MSARARGGTKSAAIPFLELMERRRWSPLPAVVLLCGDAAFFRRQVEARFIDELFGDSPTRSLRRFDPARGVEGLLAEVLDELRTLSILSSERLVSVDPAEAFLAAYRDDLLPFVRDGFEGGHLLLHLDKPADGRTRFVRAVAESGWVVECRKPFAHPPPWETASPPWQNPLSAWTVSWARRRELTISRQDAYYLQTRVGEDPATIDDSLEKASVFLGPGKRRLDRATIDAVTGETSEDTVFGLVEKFLTGDRGAALASAERLFERGYHPAKGSPVRDPSAITMLFIGATLARLRALRRAHAIHARGGGPAQWIEAGLTSKPFLDTFRGELRGMPPRRIERVLGSLLALDRAVKSGTEPRTALTVLLAREDP